MNVCASGINEKGKNVSKVETGTLIHKKKRQRKHDKHAFHIPILEWTSWNYQHFAGARSDLRHVERIHLNVKNQSSPSCDVFKNAALASRRQPTLGQIYIKIKKLKWQAPPSTSTKLSWVYTNGIKSGCDLLNKDFEIGAIQPAWED